MVIKLTLDCNLFSSMVHMLPRTQAYVSHLKDQLPAYLKALHLQLSLPLRKHPKCDLKDKK